MINFINKNGYDSDSTNEKNKRKHVTLTIQEKLDIINLVESGKSSRQAIANHYGIGKSTVHDIHKRKNIIKNFALQNSTELSKRRRVDIKMEYSKTDVDFLFKEDLSNGIVEEETLVENFNNSEFDYNEEGYEIVYDPTLCNSSEIISKPLKETTSSTKQQEYCTKRKSKTLTLKEKYDILVQLDEGKSVSAIINKYGIGRTTLYDLKKQKQKIMEYMENSTGETRRTFKKSNYPEIESSLLEWCSQTDLFTEQQFFDKYKQLFMELRNKNSLIQSPFSGSWSWCKRFFDRNPEYKKNLITTKNLNDSMKSEKRISEAEKMLNDNDTVNNKVKMGIQKNTSNKRVIKYLSLNEKMQVLDEAFAGKPIPILADKWNISKSTAYEILKKEPELRLLSSDKINFERKVIKSPKYPEIENELSEWCLQQNPFPSYISISDKALNIFESMKLDGDFNPTTVWAKKFVERHPKLTIKYDEPFQKNSNEEIESSDDMENVIEDMQEEALEFIEPDFMMDSKQDRIEDDDCSSEYIIEELEIENSSDEMEILNYQDEESKPKEINQKDDIITDEEALNSLKLLIKYSEQRGHNRMSAYLLDYKNIIKN